MSTSPTPLSLLTEYHGEEELSRGRAAHPEGRVGDPRNRERGIVCRTRYLHRQHDRKYHELRVDRIGRLRKVVSGDVFDTAGMCAGIRGFDRDHQVGRAQYTLALDHRLYGGCATTNSVGLREFVEALAAPWANASATSYVPDVLEFFHHSSFVAGEDVLAAGEVATRHDGYVHSVSNYSGHYKPKKEHLLHILDLLATRGVPMGDVVADFIGEDGVLRHYPAKAWLAAGGDGIAELATSRERTNMLSTFAQFVE